MKQKYALIPFVVFLGIFVGLNIFYADIEQTAKDCFPIFAVFIAIAVAFFTFPKNTTLQEKIDVFVNGSAQPIIIHMCYIFMLSTVFTYILEKIEAIEAAVNISLYVTPVSFLLPGLFIITSLFSLTIGSSMGSIAAFMPIAIKLATTAGIPLPLICGIVICGSMVGDNLSILSDTTIAAVKVTSCSMIEKFKMNAYIALPAFVSALCILLYQNTLYAQNITSITNYAPDMGDIIALTPYFLIFLLAIYGLDILIALSLSIFAATAIGLLTNKFSPSECIPFIFDGFYQSKAMVHVFVLVIFLSGLSKIIAHNGGIEYILKKIESNIKEPLHARLAIFFLVCFVNCAIVINTISIVVAGPIAIKIGKKHNLKNSEVATILDIGSCVSQGILPYTPQLLLAASMANISALAILPYLAYQYVLCGSIIGYFFYKRTLQ